MKSSVIYSSLHLISKKMKNFNFKSRKILATTLFLSSGLTILSTSNPVKAEGVCPDPSTITSPNGDGDTSSFIQLANGSCYDTPEEYGVTIFRMGLCTSDPSPTSAGSAPDTSSCTFTFSKDDGVGEAASFAAGEKRSFRNIFICLLLVVTHMLILKLKIVLILKPNTDLVMQKYHILLMVLWRSRYCKELRDSSCWRICDHNSSNEYILWR